MSIPVLWDPILVPLILGTPTFREAAAARKDREVQDFWEKFWCLPRVALRDLGFCKVRGRCFWVPMRRVIVFWDLYWGPPLQGNYRIDAEGYPIGGPYDKDYTFAPTFTRLHLLVLSPPLPANKLPGSTTSGLDAVELT